MTSDARPTVVLLGASNLTRGISTVVRTLQIAHGCPLRIVTALGYGRSFGMPSRVLLRGLPAILECGLWRAIEQLAQRPAHLSALITDIGNDVMYEASPSQIVGWVAQCIDRLITAGASLINITALPVGSIVRVKPWQYEVVRGILFPTRRLKFDDAVASALETQYRLERLVADSPHAARLRLFHHERDWYGFDPIHIKRRRWPAAWARFLACEPRQEDLRAGASMRRWLQLREHMPEHYEILGIARHRLQPLWLPDGTTVEMY